MAEGKNQRRYQHGWKSAPPVASHAKRTLKERKSYSSKRELFTQPRHGGLVQKGLDAGDLVIAKEIVDAAGEQECRCNPDGGPAPREACFRQYQANFLSRKPESKDDQKRQDDREQLAGPVPMRTVDVRCLDDREHIENEIQGGSKHPDRLDGTRQASAQGTSEERSHQGWNKVPGCFHNALLYDSSPVRQYFFRAQLTVRVPRSTETTSNGVPVLPAW